MLAGTHIIVGGAMGAAVYEMFRRLPPPLNHPQITQAFSLAAGITSHFVLDSIPHSEYGNLNIFQVPLFLILVPESVLAAIAVWFWGCVPERSNRNIMIATAVFGGALPDLLWIFCAWYDRLLGESYELSQLVFAVHGYFHATIPMIASSSLLIQFILIFNSLTILNVTRRRAVMAPAR